MKVKAEVGINWASHSLRSPVFWTALTCGILTCQILIGSVPSALAQNCQIASDLDDATRTALTATSRRYFDLAAKGDAASLRQSATTSLSADFSGIEAMVKDGQKDLAGAQATAKSVFLLEVEGSAPIPNAEFYCGVFGNNGQTSGSAVFTLDNLAPGKYAVVILDASSSNMRESFSMILQLAGSDWKLGGLYLKAAQIAGHDSNWFAARAREFKAKGQSHNAWLFAVEARSLASPLPFMSTLTSDKLFDESQTMLPADVPTNGKTSDLVVGTTTYKLTALFPAAVGNVLDLIVKYQAADVSNTTQANQNNITVMKALVAKYPEVREAFAAVVARAVEPSGRDFGTMLVMKDVK